MKQKYLLEYLLMTIFTIAVLLFGSTRVIGSITPRQIMAIIMLMLCIFKSCINVDKYFGIYLVFIFFFGISSLLTGYIIDYLHVLVGFYFVCFIAYQSAKLLSSYDSGIIVIVNTLVVIGVLDALVTYGQYFQIERLASIPDSLGIVSNDYGDLDLLDMDETLAGITVPGLFGRVLNGIYLSCFAILALYNRKGIPSILNIVVALFLLGALFFVQERSATMVGFGLFVVSIFLIIIRYNRKFKYLLIPLFIIAIVVIVSQFLEFATMTDTRYSLGLDPTNRDKLYQRSIDFILSNPFGGIFEFRQYSASPHNLIFNALVYGGVFGFIALIVLFYIQIKDCYYLLKSKDFKDNVLSLAFLAIFINSLVHNSSIVTGDVLTWLLWGMIAIVLHNEKKNRVMKGSIQSFI